MYLKVSQKKIDNERTLIKMILKLNQIGLGSMGDKIEKYVSDAQRCGLIILCGEDVEKLKTKAINIRNQINQDIVRQ